MTKVSILGAGSMGTALAKLISENVDEIYLWVRRKEIYENIKKLKVNIEYFPLIKLPDNVIPINNLEEIVDSEYIFLAVPSHAVRKVIYESKKFISMGAIVINTAKGIEYPPFKRMSEVIHEELKCENIVVMSGPNFASEIIDGKISATTISSYNNSKEINRKVRYILETNNFIVEISNDFIGVELCSILKNVYASGIGICEAIGINQNAIFFIFTEILKEMKRIILSSGGRAETLFCYCGFGDLCLTSISNRSRNKTIGILYGQKMYGFDETGGIIFEGKRSILGIRELCQKKGVECNFIEFIYEVIYEKKEPKRAFYELWTKYKTRSYDDFY